VLGLGSDATIVGGLRIVRAHNVILRNLSITGGPDAIDIERSDHVWVDHCDLSECEDGLLDIKHASDFVTVSWSHFHDHHKTCLVGHSDKPSARAEDAGHLRVTYHHNFFDGTETRHPRVRYAEPVHVFNNYFLKNDHGVHSAMDAGVLVEGNYFEGVRYPIDTEFGDSPEPGRLLERENLYVGCKNKPQPRGTVKEIGDAYRYTLDAAADVPGMVRRGAGVGTIGAGAAR
jgi:pectate lyase